MMFKVRSTAIPNIKEKVTRKHITSHCSSKRIEWRRTNSRSEIIHGSSRLILVNRLSMRFALDPFPSHATISKI
jgi:hypothetical protein